MGFRSILLLECNQIKALSAQKDAPTTPHEARATILAELGGAHRVEKATKAILFWLLVLGLLQTKLQKLRSKPSGDFHMARVRDTLDCQSGKAFAQAHSSKARQEGLQSIRQPVPGTSPTRFL